MSARPNWNETIALFGGSFDPPHVGHREAVRGLFELPGIKAAWVIPAAKPPQKATSTPSHHRLEMARLGFAGLPQISIEEIEILRESRNEPSYSFETVQELRKRTSRLAFVIGADQLAKFHTWHRFADLLSLCDWIVLSRKPDGADLAEETLSQWQASGLAQRVQAGTRTPTWSLPDGKHWLTVVPTEAPEISSTRLREMISRGEQPSPQWLLPEVWTYLKQHRLYGS